MPKAVNERELVLDILLSVTRDQEYSHIVLKGVLDKYAYLDKKKRAFITRNVEGTLERMVELDYIINQFSKFPVDKMKPVIRNIIRSAVYQLKYMDSVPNSAVCNEAVKLAAKKGFHTLKGFVNGLLRNIARNIETIQYPDRKDLILYLSVRYSMPEWIVKQWLTTYGETRTEGMLAEFLKVAPTTVRFDPERIKKADLLQMLNNEGVKAEEHPGFPEALLLTEYDALGRLHSFCRGYYQVQDVSSMKVAEKALVKPGDYVIDVCAAPGGKALHLAEKLKGTGWVEARDLTERKVQLIEDNITRAGLRNIRAVRQDALKYDPGSEEKADVLIADLPCSGLGVLGKKSDLKYRITEQAQHDLAKLQRDILAVVQRYVKRGGRLIYSTCTINRAENEENTRWFLKEYKDYQLLSEEQILPGQDGGDGFYIAVIERKKNE